MTEQDQCSLEWQLGMIGTPMRIAEQHARASSDISSCGPAFLAFFVQKLIEAAELVSGMPREKATRLAADMVLGTGKLLNEGGFTPQSLRRHVTIPGGIIEAGLELLEAELDNTFVRLLQATHAKYDEDVEKVERQFSGDSIE